MVIEKVSLYTLIVLLCGIILLFVTFFQNVKIFQSTGQLKIETDFVTTTLKDFGISKTGGTYNRKYHIRNRSERYNVLLIIVDDMRPDMECFGDSPFKVYTPNINMLAKKSLVLRQAYIQYTLCGPSRTSLLTGRRPGTHGLYNNSAVNVSKTNFTNMFAYFKRHGYNTYSNGKTFHYHRDSPWLTATDTWSEPPELPSGKNKNSLLE